MLTRGTTKGLLYSELGRIQEAIECYDKVLEITPEHARAWHNRGDCS